MKGLRICRRLLSLLGAALFFTSLNAERLVILHTNDTHSTIDPLEDGTGGILQRKAIFDSIRNVEKNVLTIDAGDAVQGTLYFKYFAGDVEYPLMNMCGYDFRILGNHEFDNGMEALAKYYGEVDGTPLSSNYDFSGTLLNGIFKEYEIKEIEGKKIGFFGINIDPSGIISHKNIDVNFKEVIPTANAIAKKLKEEGCDMIVAITHIGYEKVNDKPTDIDIAQNSEDIDLIIGGHTHTLIDPEHPEVYNSLIPNAKGRQVRVVQAGKQGLNIGKLSIDLDGLPVKNGGEITYELIKVTDRFPEDILDQGMKEFLKPYRAAVDSVNNHVVAQAAYDLPKERLGGLANLTADIAYLHGKEIVDSLRKAGNQVPYPDMSIMNVGGIRHHMPQGDITEGQILSTYPFSNRFVLISIKGEDIIKAMRVSALKGGEAISGNVRVVTDWKGDLKRVVIDGKEMDPDKEYVVATIDYVAEGNDDLVSLANHKKIWESDEEIAVPILEWIKRQNTLGLEIGPDCRNRFVVDLTDRKF